MTNHGADREGRNPRFAALVQEIVNANFPPSLNEMARRTRLTNMTIAKVLDGRQPTWHTTYQIAHAYPDRARELFDLSGFPMPVDLLPGVEEATRKSGMPPRETIEDLLRRFLRGDLVA